MPALTFRTNRETDSGRSRNRFLEVLGAFVRQWRMERRLRRRDGSFRSTDLTRLRAAYGAMSADEFEEINGPQEWLNRFVIPRALRDQRSSGPWTIVDLGCGSGGSSTILARHAPAGSELIGYDMCARLLERAGQREYLDASGNRMRARFVCQSVTEKLRDADGRLLPDAVVDVANAAGVVGHHFSPRDLHVLAAELRRVLAPDGVAILDAGPKMPARDLIRSLARYGFELVSRHRIVPFSGRYSISFRLKGRFDSAGRQPVRRPARERKQRRRPSQSRRSVQSSRRS